MLPAHRRIERRGGRNPERLAAGRHDRSRAVIEGRPSAVGASSFRLRHAERLAECARIVAAPIGRDGRDRAHRHGCTPAIAASVARIGALADVRRITLIERGHRRFHLEVSRRRLDRPGTAVEGRRRRQRRRQRQELVAVDLARLVRPAHAARGLGGRGCRSLDVRAAARTPERDPAGEHDETPRCSRPEAEAQPAQGPIHRRQPVPGMARLASMRQPQPPATGRGPGQSRESARPPIIARR